MHRDVESAAMGEKMSPYCHHYHRAVEILTRRWTPEIVRALLAGKTRFSEFTGAIPGLSDRVLSERLKDLEADGIVTRCVEPTTPVQIRYRLTEKGEGLANAVGAISSWADKWVTLEEVEGTSPSR